MPCRRAHRRPCPDRNPEPPTPHPRKPLTSITANPAARPRAALLLGATGLVGGHVLDLLLASPAYGRVTVVGRRALDREHPRLVQHVTDMDRMADHPEWFAVDDVFCCLGTTIAAAGSQEAFRRVDHDYVVQAAELAARGGAVRYLLVSSSGANARSRIFYSRTKGEAEDGVRATTIPGVTLLRPSLLMGEREEHRAGEALAQKVAPVLNRVLVGPLRRYRGVDAHVVAQAMVRLAQDEPRGVRVVESEQIQELGAA
ncbi:oxidoreductase [Longimicrobium terrae]|uniref:Uncharacterized protein YbjT (DUF2867 family) n=1 Tax=Longimicrobium terrae TaxID=1639882 RepID=A0A841GXU1_9BACT|nr:oxidoreductase [Longimicrobium terrae]MBB4636168.1 uncharacterized protein YbjT (DUF2867 family) [Longimicrobium terrae]MBB6070563.1 uncharacterized protein YbjT (DUF2867 family) [Longimicrobium terrae]